MGCPVNKSEEECGIHTDNLAKFKFQVAGRLIDEDNKVIKSGYQLHGDAVNGRYIEVESHCIVCHLMIERKVNE